MRPFVLLPEIEASTLGVASHFVENGIKRDLPKSFYAPTPRGQPRRYSRENVLELSLAQTFANHGVSLGAAFAYGSRFAQQVVAGQKVRRFLVFRSNDPNISVPTDDLGAPVVLKHLKTEQGEATGLTVVNVGEIVRRVEALFAEATS